MEAHVAADATPPEPGPVAERVEIIPIKAVKVADRLRPASDAHVQWFVGDIFANGLMTRIDVCREGEGYRLVDGLHRLEACKRLGWETITARIGDHETLGRRLREISANLVRHELSPIDRSAFVAEWYQTQLQMRGVSLGEHRQKMGGLAYAARVKAEAEGAGEMISSAYDLQGQIAEKLGLTTRTIKNDIALYRGLKPETVEALRDTPIAGKSGQLLALAKLGPDEQAKVTAVIVAGKAGSASEAIQHVRGGRKERPEEKKLTAAIAAFRKLAAKQQAVFLQAIAQDKLPKGFAITVPGGAA